jgi:hypothetical protein
MKSKRHVKRVVLNPRATRRSKQNKLEHIQQLQELQRDIEAWKEESRHWEKELDKPLI